MFVPREIGRSFDRLAGAYNLIAIVGPRQAGKTTFLKERLSTFGGEYLTFDDPDVLGVFDEDIKRFEELFMHADRIVGLDEVQYGKDSGRKLKYLADNGRRIWITSSSQILLGRETLSWLVGRVSALKLYPFSFKEFAVARGQKVTIDRVSQRLVQEQIVYGSYPKVVLEKDVSLKRVMLGDLKETLILKDISRTFALRDINGLSSLARYLSQSIGNQLSFERVSSDLGISFPTVKKYLDAMEKSYLVALVQPFSSNKLKELVKRPKSYFIDTGLRNALANTFPTNLDGEGKLFENYVFTELLKAGFEPKYWSTKGGAEVDFVVEKEGRPVPIEVKLHAESKVERSLRSFVDVYRPAQAFIVSYRGSHSSVSMGRCSVAFTDAPGLIGQLVR